MSEKPIPMEGTVSDNPIAVLTARMDRLEGEIKAVRTLAEDADHTADELEGVVDELKLDVDGLEDCDCDGHDADDNALQELRDEIRYLVQRMDRLELSLRRERAAS